MWSHADTVINQNTRVGNALFWTNAKENITVAVETEILVTNHIESHLQNPTTRNLDILVQFVTLRIMLLICVLVEMKPGNVYRRPRKVLGGVLMTMMKLDWKLRDRTGMQV
jgi:hypothetical protein